MWLGLGGRRWGGLWGFRFVYVVYVYEFVNEYEEKGVGFDAEGEGVNSYV